MMGPWRTVGFRLAASLVLIVSPLQCLTAWQESEWEGTQSAEVQRTLDSHFPFRAPTDREAWAHRAQALRFHLQMSLGLWPMPTAIPLQPVEHGLIDLGDCTVSRVYFESFPGFYVTGNLYRPKSQTQPGPGVLCPHGHFRNGRFTRSSDEEVKRMLAVGEEKHEPNARSPLQAHCTHLARMGCTVFHYDMVGYADSQQIPEAVAHGFSKARPNENQPEAWGFFSPRAELNLQSIMGLQTWNSIRALDYLCSLPEVDARRIGVTGCSGGGTQTFLLTALDSRVTAAFPAAMVSTRMQGGCTCENCSNLRVATGNVEITALAAPRPVAMSAANDWTRDLASDGFPELVKLYELLQAPENTFLSSSLSFPHGFNQVARRVMYGWFDRHLPIRGNPEGLSMNQIHEGPIPEDSVLSEKPITFLTPEQLTVWNDLHPRPPGGAAVEHGVTRYWREDQAQKVAERIRARDPDLRLAVRSLLNELPLLGADERLRQFPDDRPIQLPAPNYQGIQAMRISVGCKRETGRLEGLRLLKPGNERAIPMGAIIVTSRLEAALQRPDIQRLVQRGGVTFLVDASPFETENRLVDNGREAAGYTYGYNRSNVARHARALTWLMDEQPFGESAVIDLVCLDSSPAALIVAAAATKRRVGRVLLPASFSFQGVDSLRHKDFFPGGLKLGDAEGLLKISQAQQVVLIGESEEEQSLHVEQLSVKQAP